MTRESVLARTMVELADNLVDDFDIVDVLTTLSDRCVDVLDIAAAGIMLATPDGQLQADDLVERGDARRRAVRAAVRRRALPGLLPQRPTGRQPGPDHRRLALAPLRARAVDAGFLASDAIPMRLRGQIIGALNLFRTEIGSLSDDDVAIAQALADIATIAILQNRTAVMAASQHPLERRCPAVS